MNILRIHGKFFGVFNNFLNQDIRASPIIVFITFNL